jgi:Flp pilus assembly pilin Flp
MPSANEPQYRPTHAAIPAESIGSSSNSVASEVLVSNSFSRCRALLRRTRRSVERGATAVEYALMVGLIAVGIVTAVSSLRDKTTDSLNQTAASTAGLIFPPRLKPNEPFRVKYIRNDTGANGWTSVGVPGAAHAKGTQNTDWDVLTKSDGVEYTADVRAPLTAGTMQVQVHKADGTVIETGVLRVTP